MQPHCHIEYEGCRLKGYFLGDNRTYRIGDICLWEPEFAWPGKWINGAHVAHEPVGGREYWVVVKRQRLTAILAYRPHETMDFWHHRALVEREYKIPPPPAGLWPPQSWEYFEAVQDRCYWDHQALTRAHEELARREGHDDAMTSMDDVEAIESPEDPYVVVSINGIRVVTRRESQSCSCPHDPFAECEELPCPEDVVESVREFDGWRWGETLLRSAVSFHVRKLLIQTHRWPSSVGLPLVHAVDVQDGRAGGQIMVKIYRFPHVSLRQKNC